MSELSSSPLSNALVTVFGGGGYIGNYVTKALLARGARVRIASRKGASTGSDTVEVVRCNIMRDDEITAALEGADYVVNLVGDFTGDLITLMGESPGHMARTASANGAKGFVHVSAIGADAASPTAYGKGKALGEARVLEGFENAVILRPSIVFGEDDNFLNLFAGMIQYLPVLPVFGPDKPLQLVYVEDVAEAVMTALEAPQTHGGKTFELGGPERLTMVQIHERIAKAQGRKRHFLEVADKASALFASLPLTPMSTDQWTLLKAGNVVAGGAHTIANLGIEARPLGTFLDQWMAKYR